VSARNLKCKATVKTVKKTPVTLSKTVLNQVRDGMREASRGLGSLYFEARVLTNVSLLSQASHILLSKVGARHEFRLADGELTFCSSKLERVKEQTAALVEDLKKDKFEVWRYRIGEVMMDSNNFDTLKLL
jgi:hypothetical protein